LRFALIKNHQLLIMRIKQSWAESPSSIAQGNALCTEMMKAEAPQGRNLCGTIDCALLGLHVGCRNNRRALPYANDVRLSAYFIRINP